MKKFIFAGLLALFVMSCNGVCGNSPAGDSISTDSVNTDSVAVDSVAVDSTLASTSPVGDSAAVVLK